MATPEGLLAALLEDVLAGQRGRLPIAVGGGGLSVAARCLQGSSAVRYAFFADRLLSGKSSADFRERVVATLFVRLCHPAKGCGEVQVATDRLKLLPLPVQAVITERNRVCRCWVSHIKAALRDECSPAIGLLDAVLGELIPGADALEHEVERLYARLAQINIFV